MNQPDPAHHAEDRTSVRCAVITVSDTRTLETDRGGDRLVKLAINAGYRVTHRDLVPDEPRQMQALLESLGRCDDVDVILMTGGTGVSPRDQTYETVTSLLTKPLPGYGELFRALSFAEIGPAAMLSRATGGVMGNKVLLTMPGSLAAVELAMTRIILPELGHLVAQAI